MFILLFFSDMTNNNLQRKKRQSSGISPNTIALLRVLLASLTLFSAMAFINEKF